MICLIFRNFYFGEAGTVSVAGLVRMFTDLRHVVEAHRFTELVVSQLGSVWLYQFSHQVRCFAKFKFFNFFFGQYDNITATLYQI
jgi:hypothetical protein